MNFLLALLLTIPAFADDAQPAPKPSDKDCKGCGISVTMEQHLKDLAAKDQQLEEAQRLIAQYQRAFTESQRDVVLYRTSFNACSDAIQAKQRPLAPQEKAK